MAHTTPAADFVYIIARVGKGAMNRWNHAVANCAMNELAIAFIIAK